MEVYIDDMLIKSKQASDHVQHLSEAFDVLRRYGMKLNPTKCTFGVSAGKFLGYVVTQRGIEAIPNQIKALINIQSPRNVKEVQKLTGRVTALNHFISWSSERCHLFYDVLRKNKGFDWSQQHEDVLQELKKYLASPPLLSKLSDGETLQLYLAVSSVFVSAVLTREAESQQLPIYYVSKCLLDAETRYSSLEKLILAIVVAVKKLRHYFETYTIIVMTNYPVKAVLRLPELTGRMSKWEITLSGYDIQFRPRTAIKSQAWADFVADFSPELEKLTNDEVAKINHIGHEPWVLFVDGSSNFRDAGLGIVLELPQGGKIPRDQNMQADALANLGSSLRDVSFTSVLIVHLANPTVARGDREIVATSAERLQDDQDVVGNINNIVAASDLDTEEVSVSWTKPFYDYLANDVLPADKAKARRIRFKASWYVRIQGVLFKKSAAGPYLRCLEKDQWGQVLIDMHEGTCGNHLGGRSLTNRVLCMGYYWPTMKKDAIRTTTKNSTGETPFMLVYGSEAVLHIEIEEPTLRVLMYSEDANWAALRTALDLVLEVRGNALLRMQLYKLRMAREFNKRVARRPLKLGDLVLRKMEAVGRAKELGQLTPNWEGPYKISK
ncbi:uncharacterized protein LOC130591816 [Beta vulgaris subsp. vulgaris]|uniref:uncharacterized protein LOC130591816 n=1 Tax=Beta vulgaris subsp. vulgaris TaxID=3555 RepID=UPI002546FEF8|nr:uncharacterized protein LOC130591816 [Beta vulgaris subsp. vulgaris]